MGCGGRGLGLASRLLGLRSRIRVVLMEGKSLHDLQYATPPFLPRSLGLWGRAGGVS